MLVAAIIAVAIVTSLTVDLGPAARRALEEQGSRYIERPMRIGRLSVHVLTGKYVIEDMIIDGLHPGDRPFFTAKRISIAMDWATAMRQHPEFLITSVEMTDWQMLVEKWENIHNMPRFTRDDQPQGPRRFTTTLQYLSASRGQFTYEDHQTPWSIVCPNLDFTLGNVPNYHGQAVFSGGTVQIQNYKPMWANLRARFRLDGPHVDLDRIEIDSDGARTLARGSVELGKNWPEQSYDFESRLQFPRMGDIFFSDQNWNLTGDGDVTGRFHLFKGGHDVSGRFKSDVLGWKDYRFPALAGSLHWTPTAFDVWDASHAGWETADDATLAQMAHAFRDAAIAAHADLFTLNECPSTTGSSANVRVQLAKLLRYLHEPDAQGRQLWGVVYFTEKAATVSTSAGLAQRVMRSVTGLKPARMKKRQMTTERMNATTWLRVMAEVMQVMARYAPARNRLPK